MFGTYWVEVKRNVKSFMSSLKKKHMDNVIPKEQENDILTADSSIFYNQNENSSNTIKETEYSKRLGTVTRLYSNHGFIDDTIFFDIKVAAHLSTELKVGSQIRYLLYRNLRADHLTVVKIEGVIDQYWDQSENIAEHNEENVENFQLPDYFLTSQRNIPGTIIGITPNCIIAETKYKSIDVDLNAVKCDFKPKEGDRIYLCSKVENDEGYVYRHGEILEVLGIFPARILTDEKCTLKDIKDDWGVLNENCYITFDILPEGLRLTVGDVISGDIIECDRGIFTWRCISINKIKKCEQEKEIIENGSSKRNGKHAVTICKDPVCILGGLDKEQTVNVTLFNNCQQTRVSTGINFLNQHRRSAMVNLIDSDIENGFKIPSKSTYVIQFCVKSKFFGESRESFFINFGPFRIKRSIIIHVCEDEETAEILRSKYSQNEKPPVTVCKDPVCILGGLDKEQTVNVTLFNNCQKTMVSTGINFLNQHRRSAMVNLTDSGIENGFEIPSKSTYVIQFCVKSKFFGKSRESFLINFGPFRIKRSIIIHVCEDEETAEILRSKYSQNLSSHNATIYNEQQVIPGVGLLQNRRFIARQIPSFDVPMRLRNACLTNESKTHIIEHIEGMYPCLQEKLSFKNYVQRFQTLIHLEEIEYFVNFRRYDRERANFRHEGEYLALIIDNLSEKRPSLVIGDVIRAINPFVENSAIYEGIIHKVCGDKVLLKFNSSFHNMYRNEDYRLEFFLSRFTFRKSHFAIERAVKHLGEQFLFPSTVVPRKIPQLNVQFDERLNMHLNKTELKWFNPRLNEFQRRAVYNILRGETLNMPYVVFGPPGTGKTFTIVETILQLLKHVNSARIIVATPSNSSANLIATRLIDSGEVCPGDFVRLVSQALIAKEAIPEHLMPYSATVHDMDGTCKNEIITTESGLKLRCQMKYLGRHKITIGTCTTVGNYMLLNFPPDHFSHILIDEAGQCSEPQIMIAITQVTQYHGQVVLAGDPYQLQPIIFNRYADERGLTLSFLERILHRAPYRKDNIRFPNTSGFDPRLVTKLLYNFRALPSMLKVYNDLFYDSELLPVVNEDSSREANIVKKILPELCSDSNKRSKTHGTFFIGIRSENAQDKDSPSWYNRLEASNVFLWTVKLYCQNVLSQDIGIITPYARQVQYLRNMFITANVEVPKIGTVEEFQGQERDFILISTVRSSSSQTSNDLKNSLGFVSCKNRMNVAISRARCLMIVFGNPHILYKDLYWHRYIKYCVANDAYEGCDLPEGFDTMAEENCIRKVLNSTD